MSFASQVFNLSVKKRERRWAGGKNTQISRKTCSSKNSPCAQLKQKVNKYLTKHNRKNIPSRKYIAFFFCSSGEILLPILLLPKAGQYILLVHQRIQNNLHPIAFCSFFGSLNLGWKINFNATQFFSAFVSVHTWLDIVEGDCQKV